MKLIVTTCAIIVLLANTGCTPREESAISNSSPPASFPSGPDHEGEKTGQTDAEVPSPPPSAPSAPTTLDSDPDAGLSDAVIASIPSTEPDSNQHHCETGVTPCGVSQTPVVTTAPPPGTPSGGSHHGGQGNPEDLAVSNPALDKADRARLPGPLFEHDTRDRQMTDKLLQRRVNGLSAGQMPGGPASRPPAPLTPTTMR